MSVFSKVRLLVPLSNGKVFGKGCLNLLRLGELVGWLVDQLTGRLVH